MVWREQVKPLPVELWLRELGRLGTWCDDAPTDDDERAVRRAFHLSVLAPLGVQQLFAPTISLGELDLLLEQGETEAAARAAIGTNALIDVEQIARSQRWLASYSIGGERPAHGEASTAVAAMIRAWTAFFRLAED